jgi:hypothetical protein
VDDTDGLELVAPGVVRTHLLGELAKLPPDEHLAALTALDRHEVEIVLTDRTTVTVVVADRWTFDVTITRQDAQPDG